MNLQVGVKIFLKNRAGEYLVLKRSSEKYKDTKRIWDIVGGRIDPGTTLLENLKREVKEETKMTIVGEPKLVFSQDIIMNDDRDRHVVRLTYIGEAIGEPSLDLSENVEFKWLSAKELIKMEEFDIFAREVLENGLVS
jgi:8-oxo-dGTP pyrophosphatase MutT (NUDIX family)